jgi:hypothetical protein
MSAPRGIGIGEMAAIEGDRMYSNGNRSSGRSAAYAAGRESEDLAWRLSHTVESLQETIAVLREGANELAIDNAILRIENERLRKAARLASPKRS